MGAQSILPVSVRQHSRNVKLRNMHYLSKLSHKLCINVCFTSFRTQRQPTEEYSAKIRNRYTVRISLFLLITQIIDLIPTYFFNVTMA